VLTGIVVGGLSLYNDGKGIKMVVVFTPLPKPPAKGKRPRTNAKPATVSKISHFHEDFTLRDFLTKVLDMNKRLDLLNGSSLYHGEELDDGDSLSLSYTILRRVTEPISITCEEDFTQMKDIATKKTEAEVKLYLVEKKVCFLCSSTSPFSASVT
jgi:hypothetical protein